MSESEIIRILDKIGKLEADILELKKLLMGNGVAGVAEMARRAFEGYQHLKLSRQGWVDWAFRLIIGGMLARIIYLL